MNFNFNATQATRAIMIMTVLFAIVLTIPAYILNAWVITKLWAWYMVPAFGLPPLGMIYAYGLSVFIHMFNPTYYGEDNRPPAVQAAAVVATPLVALLLGWIGTFFM